MTLDTPPDCKQTIDVAVLCFSGALCDVTQVRRALDARPGTDLQVYRSAAWELPKYDDEMTGVADMVSWL